MTEDKIKFEVNLEEGTVKIDIFAYLKEMPIEAVEELMWDNGWWVFVYPKLMKALRDDFSTRSYNPMINEIRVALLTSDFAHGLIRNCIEGLLREIKYLDTNRRRFESAYWKIYHHPVCNNNEFHQVVNSSLGSGDYESPKMGFLRELLEKFYQENDIVFPETSEDQAVD